MKLLLLMTPFLFILGSCAHHHAKKSHHHHECTKSCKLHKDGIAYEKHCAQSVSEGDAHVMGKEEFRIDHGGQNYYFSSKKKMMAFKKDLKKSVESANKKWESRAGDRI